MKRGTKIQLKWNSNNWVFVALLLVLVSAGCQQKNSPEKKAQKPNVVLIVADDLGYGDISCYGATKINTPAIDQLASEGMRFTDAYVSSSLCTPSRYSILTGRYPWRTRLEAGVLKYFEEPLIEEGRTTIASLFHESGYHTACVGKWHLGFNWPLTDNAPENAEEAVFHSWADSAQNYIDFTRPVKGGPTDRGFAYYFGMAGSNNMQPYVFIENDRVLEAPAEDQPLAYDHYNNTMKAPNWDIKTINQVVTHKAVEVINKHFTTNSEDPLFLYFPTSAIHRPCLPTFTKGKSKAGLRGDIVVELDWTVNEIVQALKANNQFENTLLIFTSDNGPRPGDPALWLANYEKGEGYEDYHQQYFDDYQPEFVNKNGNAIWKNGWFTYGHQAAGQYLGFKSDAWNGGLRVPFIVHWPGKVKSTTVNSNSICLSDLLATFAELNCKKLDKGEGEDSYSFMSNMLDVNAPQVRESLTLTSGASGAYAVIKNGWKFIEAAEPGHWPETFYPNGPSNMEPQLYNLKEDPSEQNNLYDQMPEKVEELKQIIKNAKAKEQSEISQ